MEIETRPPAPRIFLNLSNVQGHQSNESSFLALLTVSSSYSSPAPGTLAWTRSIFVPATAAYGRTVNVIGRSIQIGRAAGAIYQR
jgi:hypothetical protein